MPRETETRRDRSFAPTDKLPERLLWVGIGVLACLMPAQNDTWWHLRAGYVMLDSKAPLFVDLFSHTAYGQHWANNGWLGQVLFAAVHQVGGLPFLTSVCALTVVAALWCTRVCTPGSPEHRLLLFAGVVSGVTLTWALRPQVFSLLLLGLVAYLVTRGRWWALPPVFLLWANLHSAVGLGLVLVLAAILGHLVANRGVPWRVLVAGALCASATLVTPQGLDFWPDVAASMARSRANEIAEWRPPDPPPANPAFWAAAIALPVMTVVFRRRPQAAERWTLVFGALLLLPLALRSMRNVSPFLMLAAPAVGVLIGDSASRQPHRVERPNRLVPRLILAAAVLAGGTIVGFTWQRAPEWIGWVPVPASAARAIEQCRGPLYNRYLDGGPLIFFAPRQRVLLDSRQDPFPNELVQAQRQVEETGDYHALFQQYGINCAALPPWSFTRQRLERDGWVRRYGDDRWIVLERRAGGASLSGGSGMK